MRRPTPRPTSGPNGQALARERLLAQGPRQGGDGESLSGRDQVQLGAAWWEERQVRSDWAWAPRRPGQETAFCKEHLASEKMGSWRWGRAQGLGKLIRAPSSWPTQGRVARA